MFCARARARVMVRRGAPALGGRPRGLRFENRDILGHFGTWLIQARRHEGTKARRHEGTEWGPGGEADSADLLHLIPCCRRHHFVASCLDGFVALVHHLPLRKTGGVMRFGEHFCAADFYKQGISRGICVEIIWDLGFGAVGILVNGAQRAAGQGWFKRLRSLAMASVTSLPLASMGGPGGLFAGRQAVVGELGTGGDLGAEPIGRVEGAELAL